MKITSISYSESREMRTDIGLSMWERVGMEADLDDNEPMQEALSKLKTLVRQSLTPARSEETLPLYPLKTTKSSKEEQIEGFKQALSMTTSKSSLEKLFKKISDNTPELKDAYDEKMKEFGG